MKAYTDLEQSKKLAEFLPIESADMYYHNRIDIPDNFPLPIEWKRGLPLLSQEIPCWSLAALLDILPDRTCVYKKTCKDGRVKYKGVVKGCKELILKDNPVDACYKMIIKLHEQKIL